MAEDEINITISGWPGSGTTSLTLLLAKLLHWRCLNIGRIFRDIGKKLGYSDEGTGRPQFDEFIEPIIGNTLDNYSEYKLLHDSGLILESDIAGFKIGKHPKVFSIFLKTLKEERFARVTKEGRENAVHILEERDRILREKYRELWQIDVFSEELINRKFNLVIDNTSMSLENELQNVIASLSTQAPLKSNFDWKLINKRISPEVQKFLQTGKEDLRKKLSRSGLLLGTDEQILEITKLFPEDVQQFPPNLQAIFLGQNI